MSTEAFLYFLIGSLFALWFVCSKDEYINQVSNDRPGAFCLFTLFLFCAWPIPVILVVLDRFKKY